MSNETGKGPQLEYLVSGLFQNQGYLTRRSIPLHYGESNQDATDIDVVGIIFTPPFQLHKVICDCKNKQKSKPYERIFWAKGLAQFVGAKDVYVSLPQASWDTVKFAQKGDVRILTSDNVEEYYKLNPNLYGTADDKFYSSFFSNINNEIKSNKALAEVWNSLRKLFLNIDPYVSVNIAMELLLNASKQLVYSKDSGAKYTNSFWKYVCCESIVLVGLNILNICSDTLCLPVKAREQHILSKLTYGDIEPNKINTILEYAKNVANEMIKSSVPKTALPKSNVVDFGEISPPPYANNIIGLVERALQNPEWYINLPQVLDLILFEFAVKNKQFTISTFENVFKTGYTEGKIKAAKNVLVFVKNACNTNFKLLWDNSDSFFEKRNESINKADNLQEKTSENLVSNENVEILSNNKEPKN